MTDSAYTSWTTERDTAVQLASDASIEAGLSGRIVVFKVPIQALDEDRVFEGEEREDEYLIEGTVESVTISDSDEEEEYE